MYYSCWRAIASILKFHTLPVTDFLGCVNVMLKSLPEEQAGHRVYDGNVVLAGLEEAFAGELHLTVEQGWETKM